MGSGFYELFNSRVLTVLLPGCSLFATLLWGQVPLTVDPERPVLSSGMILSEWKAASADHALRSGLPGLAGRLYADLLAEDGLEPSKRVYLVERQAASLIARRRFSEALDTLQSIQEESRGPVYHLYSAVAHYADGEEVDIGLMRAALDTVEAGDFGSEERPWYFLAQALLAELDGFGEGLATFYEKALASAVSPEQKTFFRSLLICEQIKREPANKSLANQLGKDLDAVWGTPATFAFVKKYAVVLNKLGRDSAADRLIDRALSDPRSGIGLQERDQLLLFRAMLEGVDSLSGRAALRELIRNGNQREAMAVALQLLEGTENFLGQAEFADFLDEIITQSEAHPLLGQIYYLRSELALASGNIEQAENDALLLLEQYPGLKEIDNVYRMFAYAALQRSPPQYRAAADFLNQLRARDLSDAQHVLVSRLIGDCYFLKGDYADAADFYESAYQAAFGSEYESGLILRLVTAELRDGQLETAIEHVDSADAIDGVSVTDRWQLEWNIARALQSQGEIARALLRLGEVLESGQDVSVPTALDLRLRWLQARLRMTAGLTSDLLKEVDVLLSRIESLPVGLLDLDETRLLMTESLLLRAELMLKLGDVENGLSVLVNLRETYAESEAAERSFLLVADFYLQNGNLEAAQGTLSALAVNYAGSSLAPQALLEASLISQSRGPDHYTEALRTLEILVENYPDHALVFEAKLKQGDLLRLMNDFTGAQIIYENLINRYPDHPQQYVALLSRADCLLAHARNDPDKLDKASRQYERLMDLPNLPVDFQAEVAYKWAFILDRRGIPEDAETVRTVAASRLLLNQENALQLAEAGRYWMARVLLDLGQQLEKQGDAAEARRIYRKILAYNLPGQNFARERANSLEVLIQ